MHSRIYEPLRSSPKAQFITRVPLHIRTIGNSGHLKRSPLSTTVKSRVNESWFTVKSRFEVQNLMPKFEFHIKKSQFCEKSPFKESKRADGGHSLNRDFTVLWYSSINISVVKILHEKVSGCLFPLFPFFHPEFVHSNSQSVVIHFPPWNSLTHSLTLEFTPKRRAHSPFAVSVCVYVCLSVCLCAQGVVGCVSVTGWKPPTNPNPNPVSSSSSLLRWGKFLFIFLSRLRDDDSNRPPPVHQVDPPSDEQHRLIATPCPRRSCPSTRSSCTISTTTTTSLARRELT